MLIERLYIRDFGCLHDFTLELGPGFHLLAGANQSGKTTALNFIRAALFGMPAKKRASSTDFDPRTIYHPWYGNSYGGRIEFKHLEKPYRLDVNFGDRPSADQIQLYRVDTGQRIPIALQSSVADTLLGIGREDYDHVLSFTAGQLFFASGYNFYEQLETLIYGADNGLSLHEFTRKTDEMIQLLYRKRGRCRYQDLESARVDLQKRYTAAAQAAKIKEELKNEEGELRIALEQAESQYLALQEEEEQRFFQNAETKQRAQKLQPPESPGEKSGKIRQIKRRRALCRLLIGTLWLALCILIAIPEARESLEAFLPVTLLATLDQTFPRALCLGFPFLVWLIAERQFSFRLRRLMQNRKSDDTRHFEEALPDRSIHELRQNISRARDECEQLRLQLGKLQFSLENLSSQNPANELSELQPQIRAIDQQQKDVLKLYKQLTNIRNVAAEAANNLRARYLPEICKRAAIYMSQIEGEQAPDETEIRRILWDGASHISYDDETGTHLREAEFYSAGCRDMLYICLRLALADSLFPIENKELLVFDDAFITLDPERRHRLIALLIGRIKNVTNSQILMTTSDEKSYISIPEAQAIAVHRMDKVKSHLSGS